MVTDPDAIILTFAAVIVLGFLGQVFFRASRISDILLLMAFGVGLGWVAERFGQLDTSAFAVLAPIVGLFALLIILFEGGLDLRFYDLVHGLTRALVLALFGFAFTVAAVAAAMYYVYDLDVMRGILLGSILGGASSIAVMPIVKQLPISDFTRTVLSVESALTDVLAVVGAITVAEILTLTEIPDFAGVGQSVASGFIVAIAVGLLVGFLWLRMLDSQFAKGVRYMLTVALVLLLYVSVQQGLDANGPIAVLAFGVVLGNARSLRGLLRLKSEAFDQVLRAFQSEVAFVTRAFFFVYLGLVLPVAEFDLELLSTSLILLAAIGIARALAVLIASVGSTPLDPDRPAAWAMMPRGLAAAVLAAVPSLTFGISGTENFVPITAAVIVLTNVVASFAGLVVPRLADRTRRGPVEEESVPEGAAPEETPLASERIRSRRRSRRPA